MGTYNSVIEYYQKKSFALRDEIERVADEAYTLRILSIKELGLAPEVEHLLLHPFRVIRNEAFALRLHFALLEGHLIQKSWWEITHPKRMPSDKEIELHVRSFDMNIKRGFIIGVFSVQEHTLREYIRKTNPGILNNAKDSYWKIRNHFFTNYSFNGNVQKFLSVLKLLASIRNTFHNDGLFYPYDDNRLEIEYKDHKYIFEVGKPIDFVEWELLIDLTEEIANFFFELNSNSNFYNQITT